MMAKGKMIHGAAALTIGLVLASCAGRSTRHAEAPPPPPVAEAVPARPQPPLGASAKMVLPPRGADGQYVTINSGITPAEAAWHLRAGLNVAALGCTGVQGQEIVKAYNAMLRTRAAPLAAADRAIQARTKAERGAGWQDAHDSRMTKLYNFFALPPVQSRFCAVAADVARREQQVAPTGFQAFAVEALAELSAPFDKFYADYDEYRVQLAAWDARYGGSQGTRVAAFAPAAPSIRVALPDEPVPLAAPRKAKLIKASAMADMPVPASASAKASKRSKPPKIAYATVDEINGWTGGQALSCTRCRAQRIAAR